MFTKKCKSCGKNVFTWKEFEDGTAVCNECYAKMKNEQGYRELEEQNKKTVKVDENIYTYYRMGTASLILGVIAIILLFSGVWLLFIGFPLGIIGLVLGYISEKHGFKNGKYGFYLGLVNLVIYILVILSVIYVWATANI